MASATTSTTSARSGLSPRAAARPTAWLAITAVVAASPWLGLSPAHARQLVLIAMLSLVVSGLNISFGYAGELSFAVPAMYATGAYVTAFVSVHWVNDLLVALVVSAVAGLLLGVISGVPGLRLGGWMLAVSSFFLVLLVPDVVQMLKTWTGGFQGLSGLPIPKLFGHELDRKEFVAAVVVVTSLWFVLFRNMVVSLTGDTLSVLRESPVLASSLGTSVYRTKLTAYAISGIPAAMAGCFFTYLDGFVSPDTFGLKLTIAILAASILGGSTSVYGIFVGAAVLQLGPMGSTSFGKYAFVAYGAFLVVAGVALPTGVAGLAHRFADKVKARRAPESLRVEVSRGATTLPALNGQRLTIEGVSKTFGGNAALTDVSFTVEPGEVVALIGPNGSGKTTLLNIISGYYRPTAGTVRVGDRTISGLRPHQIAQEGVARTFQTPIIPALSVEKAVGAARHRKSPVMVVETMLRLPRFIRARRHDREVVRTVLEAVDLADLANQPAQSLPLGTRRLLEMARCLAAEPAVLLLDEVASGLDDEEVAELSKLIRAIRQQGGTVVLVEHNFALVRALADRVAVLSRGQLVVIDSPEAVAEHPEVLEHYLGLMVPATAAGSATEPTS